MAATSSHDTQRIRQHKTALGARQAETVFSRGYSCIARDLVTGTSDANFAVDSGVAILTVTVNHRLGFTI
jgi:hypothetical protein